MGRLKTGNEREFKKENREIYDAQQALVKTVAKLRGDIEHMQANGVRPQDYSLGFTNGLIFAEHKMLLKRGQAKFYNAEMSIGELPKPTHLVTEIENEARALMTEVVDAVDDFFNNNVVGESELAMKEKLHAFKSFCKLHEDTAANPENNLQQDVQIDNETASTPAP